MQNKNLEQIRTVIKMFFNEYDMEDIYNYIDNNISMNEIKIISNKNRIKFSIRERLEYSFVTDISLEQQIQNFSDKSNEYLNIVNKILENRKNTEVYVTDNNSRNFTYINGNRLFPNNKNILVDGDELTLADQKFEVSICR